METIGERLRKWRKENNLTMVEICQKTGIAQGALSKYENNESLIGAKPLISLFEYFEIDITYILTGIKNTELNKNQKELLEYFDLLPEREQIKAITRIEDMAAKYQELIKAQDELSATKIG